MSKTDGVTRAKQAELWFKLVCLFIEYLFFSLLHSGSWFIIADKRNQSQRCQKITGTFPVLNI